MERVGVHLADVGDLSSPALAKILRDTADVSPSPGASSAASSSFQQQRLQSRGYPALSPAAAASAGTPGSLSYSDGSGDGTHSVGIDLSTSASPAASLASILSGGPIEPSSYSRGRKTTAAATAAADGRGESQTPPYHIGVFDSLQDDDDAQSAAAASGGEMSPGVSSGVSSVTTAASRGVSPVTVGDGDNGNRGRMMSPGQLGGYPSSLAASPLSVQQPPHAFDSGVKGGGASSASGVGSGSPVVVSTASVEVSAGRGWVSSPINASHAASEENASGFAPLESSGGGRGFHSGGDRREDAGRGRGIAIPGVVTAAVAGGRNSTSGKAEGRREIENQQQVKQQQSADFDEDAFAQQEQRMRQAFLMRLGSVDSEASSGGRHGAGGGDHDGSVTSSSIASDLQPPPSFRPADSSLIRRWEEGSREGKGFFFFILYLRERQRLTFKLTTHGTIVNSMRSTYVSTDQLGTSLSSFVSGGVSLLRRSTVGEEPVRAASERHGGC